MKLRRNFREYEDVSLKDANKLQRISNIRFLIVTVIFIVLMGSLILFKYSRVVANQSVVEKMANTMKKKNVKIMIINRGGLDSLVYECFIGARQESESIGIKIRTLSAHDDLVSFRYLLVQAGEENYDGVIIGGGNGEVIEEIIKLSNKGIPIVAFDSSPELWKIKGITMTSEDDVQTMKDALSNMFSQLQGRGNIAYLYAKTDPSLVTRHKVYEQFLKNNSGINEVERVEIDRQGSFMKAKRTITEMLKKHGKGGMDIIFSTYGEMARGAAEALKESGRKDIKVYAVGFTDADLNIMQSKDSPYDSATGVDLREVGAVNVRLVLKKIAGEKTPTKYEFKPSLITQDKLRKSKEIMNTDGLKKVIRGWGENNDFEEKWMKKLKKSHAEEIAKA